MPTRVGKIFVSLIETLKMEERNSHIDELIAAFLSGGLDKEAREELEAWIAASEDNRRYFNGWPNIEPQNSRRGLLVGSPYSNMRQPCWW